MSKVNKVYYTLGFRIHDYVTITLQVSCKPNQNQLLDMYCFNSEIDAFECIVRNKEYIINGGCFWCDLCAAFHESVLPKR